MQTHFDQTTTEELVDTLHEIIVRNIDGGEEEFEFTLPFDEWYQSTGSGVFMSLIERLSRDYEVWEGEMEIERIADNCTLYVDGECTEIYVAGRRLFWIELSDKDADE